MPRSTDPMVSVLRALRLARRRIAQPEQTADEYAEAVGAHMAEIARELETARDQLVQQAAYDRHVRAKARATRAATTRRQRAGVS